MSREPIATIPNALTALRALGIPLFVWLYLSENRPLLGFIVLTVGAITDYLDGKIARALNQTSKLGAAMDPAIDRAYIAATIISLQIKDVIPLWLVIMLIGRDLLLLPMLLINKKRTGEVFEVTYLGKSATFCLLYAFPFLLLSDVGAMGNFCFVIGWAFAGWGVGLYLLTGLQYSYSALKSQQQ
jgi:cardiolipin synthase